MTAHPNRLARLREEKGVSQANVARVLGITVPAVSTHESGRRKLSSQTLKMYADYYGVPAIEILIDPKDISDVRHS